MLVLDRRVGQCIIIGDNIKIKILDIGRYRIKIGIEVPDDVTILREELVDRADSPGR